MATEQRYIDIIAEKAQKNADADPDTSGLSYILYKTTSQMLNEMFTVVPGKDDEETKLVKGLICAVHLPYYLSALVPEISVPVADSCVQHVLDALDGYVVSGVDDPKAMFEAMSYSPLATSPESFRGDLIGIGIA